MKKPLKPEDQRLWDMITKGVSPLQHHRSQAARNHKEVANPPIARETALKGKAETAPPLRELGHGQGIERHKARRLRRADRPYDRSIDLHGMTQAVAHAELTRFIHQSRARGDRCLLVITGKGGEKGGILRREVPRWLNEPDLRPGILAFDHAAPRHGGEGALYILLKKKG